MITRIRVRNFKSLRDVDFSLGTLNVLVGPNMGGKSNVLDLFRFLYDCWFPPAATFGPGNALTRRQGIDEVLWKGGQDKLLSIDVEFSDPKLRKFEYGIEILGGAGGYFTIQREALILRDGEREHELIARDENGRWLTNVEGSKLGWVQAERSGMELAPPNWDGYPLKDFAQNWRYHQLVPAVMKQANQMTAGNVLDFHGNNLSAWLMWLQTRSPQTFGRIVEVMRDVFPELRELLTWPTQQGTVYVTSQEQGLLRATPLFQMSDGELVFLAYLSLVLAPDELGGTLFFIEEPENHLHPRLFETLIRLLRQTQQARQDRGELLSQVICTTHSPLMLNQMTLDEILWVEKRNGATNVFKPNDKPHLRQLVENEDLGLGDLMFAGALGEQ